MSPSYAVHPDVHAVTLEDEVVVYAPGSRSLHVLAGPAAHVWHLLQHWRSFTALITELSDLFGVEVHVIERDVSRLTDELQELGLVVAVADRRP